mmetsp:Transcript_138049/g.429066  ORF Transcript_138049/g.429066 Transcript_138049/m.429066 type:complete len:234 (-) Transcript_138049:16-717(-)
MERHCRGIAHPLRSPGAGAAARCALAAGALAGRPCPRACAATRRPTPSSGTPPRGLPPPRRRRAPSSGGHPARSKRPRATGAKWVCPRPAGISRPALPWAPPQRSRSLPTTSTGGTSSAGGMGMARAPAGRLPRPAAPSSTTSWPSRSVTTCTGSCGTPATRALPATTALLTAAGPWPSLGGRPGSLGWLRARGTWGRTTTASTLASAVRIGSASATATARRSSSSTIMVPCR